MSDWLSRTQKLGKPPHLSKHSPVASGKKGRVLSLPLCLWKLTEFPTHGPTSRAVTDWVTEHMRLPVHAVSSALPTQRGPPTRFPCRVGEGTKKALTGCGQAFCKHEEPHNLLRSLFSVFNDNLPGSEGILQEGCGVLGPVNVGKGQIGIAKPEGHGDGSEPQQALGWRP